MKIAAVSILRNEQDVIESFVRHHLAVVDEIHLILHRSRDGSRDILRALLAEGLPIRVFEDEGVAFLQARRIGDLMRRAILESGADYVLALDADEFVMATGRAHLERELAAVPAGEGALMRMQTYVPAAEDAAREPCVVRRVTHRFDIGPLTASGYSLEACKVAVGRWFAERPDVRIFEGNHVVLKGGVPAPHHGLGIDLAHFPVRSLDQLHRKVVLGWVGYLAAHGDPGAKGLGAHWSRLYEALKVKGAPGWQDALEFATLYVPASRRGAPIVRAPARWLGEELRYVGLQYPQPLVGLLLDEVEALARMAVPAAAAATEAASRSAGSSPGRRAPTPRGLSG